MNLLDSMSIREKDLWGELLIDVLVALYYFPKVFALMAQGDTMLRGGEMADLVISTIVLAIVVSIVVFGAIHRKGEAEDRDERDLQFEAQGNLLAFRVLYGFLVLILGQIVMWEYFSPSDLDALLTEAGPLVVGHMILLAMILTSMVKAAVQLFQYRRSVTGG
ncbi:MAG: hypothetical protein KJN90_12010 [Gammaproteobacteria bacterium]|nr:hypothetical protein [Gammaproteobacteria bacterium]